MKPFIRKAITWISQVPVLCALGAGLALTTMPFAAGPVSAQSLTEALTATYQSNPRLLAARAALRADDEDVATALSGWRPTVTVNGSLERQFTDTDSSFALSGGENTIFPKSVELSAVQPLYRGGRTVADTKRAENVVEAGRANLVDVEQQVLFAAARSYMDVVRDQALVELTIKNEQVLRRQLEATQDRFEVGEVTRTDVSQAEARLADAQASRIAAEGDLAVSRANYEAVVGSLPGTLEFPPENQRPDIPDTIDEIKTTADQRNPVVARAWYQERAALYEISEAGGTLLPELSLSTSVSRALDPNTFTDQQDTFEIGASLRMPLYQSGAEYSRIRQLRQIAGQRRRELDQARRDVQEAAQETFEQLASVRAGIQALQASVRANQIALEGVQQEAEVGARTVLDVLNAEQELFDARVSLVRVVRDEIVARYALLQVTGGLTARALGLPVAQYDPTEHYQAVRNKWIGFGEDFDDSIGFPDLNFTE